MPTKRKRARTYSAIADKINVKSRGVQASLKAGCYLTLHCHGNIDDMKKSIANIPPISSKTKERWDSALEWLNSK